MSAFPKKKRYEGVRFNVISVTWGWVKFPGKKRYVTLELPLNVILILIAVLEQWRHSVAPSEGNTLPESRSREVPQRSHRDACADKLYAIPLLAAETWR